MKRIIIILSLLLLAMSASSLANDNSFDREEVKLPEISEQLSKLENVAGWTKLPGGQWIEKEDRIPRYISAYHGLGIDNFRLLEIRELKHKGKGYYILYKHYTNGRYKYKNLEAGWSYWYYVDAYVFEKEELPVIQLTDKKSQLFKIAVIAKSYEYYITQTYGGKYIKEISKKMPALMSDEGTSKNEVLVINAIKLDDKVRFLLLEENNYMYGLKGSLPISKSELLEEEVFRNFYYETDLSSFEDFWNLNK